MNETDHILRHLTDLCLRADRVNAWQYSAFLSPAEQDDFFRSPLSREFSFRFDGGYETAERRILVTGREDLFGYPAEPPLSVLKISPLSEKFGEELSHRDYLGAVLNLGIERELIGDILIREKHAWLFCMDSIADYLTANLTRVRKTSVKASLSSLNHTDLQPRLEPLSLNVASERLDAIVAGFTNQSRSQVGSLFSTGHVFINSRPVTDGSKHLQPGDILSVRGFGKARYEGIDRETRKGRQVVILQKYC